MKSAIEKLFLSLLFAFIIPTLIYSHTFNLDFFSNYYHESIKINSESLWNPDNFYHSENSNSEWLMNIEGRLKFWETRLRISPLLTINNQSEVDTKLRELYGVVNLGNFEITLGKSIIKLGTGYVFTPISVITPELKISDPEDILRKNEGVQLVKIDYYTENLNLSAISFKKENWRNFAFLTYYVFRGIDLYGILYYPEYRKIEYGFAFSKTLGKNVEIHSEFMHHKNSPVDYNKVYFVQNPERTFDEYLLYHPNYGNYNELILGTNITIKKINIIAEYYHNDWGLKPAWWQKLKNHYKFNFENSFDPSQSLDIFSDLTIIKQGTRGLMRDYLFLRIWKPLNKTDISEILYLNLHDRSAVTVLDLETQITPGIYLFLKSIYFIGKNGSEFKESWYNNIMQIGLRAMF